MKPVIFWNFDGTLAYREKLFASSLRLAIYIYIYKIYVLIYPIKQMEASIVICNIKGKQLPLPGV